MNTRKIHLFDTYSKHKKLFTPQNNDFVGIYSCGPTVYSYPHIGNLRAYVFSDTLRRTLEHNNFVVRHIMNITDVGHLTSDADEGMDKVEFQAKKTGKSAWEIASFFTEAFLRDLNLLNIQSPHTLCRATDHISDQIALIQKLEDLGFTYRTSDGIYFDTSKFPPYGRMVRLKADGLKEGARVKPNPEKRNLTDFALWKFSPKNERRQMEWQSPWGIGFPGWHIECSAMAMKYLGETIDIHTGGIDHIPVHHTNEIAQSETATKKQFSRYWLHCAFLLIEGQKMSKSLGNLFTLQDIVSRGYDPMTFRYLLLTAHYRSPLNFTWKSIEGAKNALNSLRIAFSEWPSGGKADALAVNEFMTAINDDLNTPRAIALLWDIVNSGKFSSSVKKATLIDFDNVLGLKLSQSVTNRVDIEDVPPTVQHLLNEREEMRHQKNWSGSDRLREVIHTMGYLIEDAPEGPRLKRLHI